MPATNNRQHPVQFGRQIFPSPSGGRSTDLKEDEDGVRNPRNVIRCWSCGFPGVDLDRDNTDGDPGDSTETVTVDSTSMTQSKIVSGCPHCGSSRGVFGPR